MNNTKKEPITINLFETFAGIGSQYKALKNIADNKGWKINHVGMVEWYIDAIIGYVAIHSNEKLNPVIENLFDENISISANSKTPIDKSYVKKLNKTLKPYYINYSKTHFNNLFDIRKVNATNLPKNIDIFTYSFPCQDLSVQGLQKGIKKGGGTRSGLLWEIERILKDAKKHFKTTELPKYLLMENVPNLIGKKHINDFNKWIEELKKIGYVSKWKILNSQDFNNPQNRNRVFCISVRKDFQKDISWFFNEIQPQETVINLLGKILDDNDKKEINLKRYKTTEYKTTKSNIISKRLLDYSTFNSECYIYNKNGIGPTLTASGANSRIKIEYENNKVRYMNSLESYLYMGFTKEDWLKVKNTGLLTDSKIIYTAGNSIVVGVLENIFDKLRFEKDEFYDYPLSINKKQKTAGI